MKTIRIVAAVLTIAATILGLVAPGSTLTAFSLIIAAFGGVALILEMPISKAIEKKRAEEAAKEEERKAAKNAENAAFAAAIAQAVLNAQNGASGGIPNT